MNKIITVLALTAAIALASCSSATKKSPLDAEWQGKGKSFSSKKFSQPMRWTPGQYIVVGTLDDGDKVSVTKSTVVKKEAGGWIFETITTNEDKEVTGMQMLIQGYERAAAKGDTSQIKVIWLKMLQKDGTVQKLDGDSLVMYNMLIQSTWTNVILTGTKFSTGGAVKVPAGNFAGTTKVHTSIKILFTSIEGDSYMHPDVPVNGVVKTISGDTVSELLDFGFNGKAVIQ